MSEIAAHPTHRMDAEYWINRHEGAQMSRLVTLAKKGVRQIREQMQRPDQDWLPVLMYITAARTFDVICIALGDGEPGSVAPEEIDGTAEMVTRTLRERNAVEAVFVATVWMTATDTRRIEGVMIAHVDTDATEIQVARITRTAGKPKLSEWQRVATDMQVPPMLIVDAMRAGI
jgi:hypothetical protein